MEELLSTFSPELSPSTTTYSDLYNTSLYNASEDIPCPAPVHKPSGSFFIQLVYVTGIVGNATAIVCLRRGERRVRNRKHLLMLTALAANDLVALLGMLSAQLVSALVAGAAASRAMCAARVLLRVFGLGSECIAVTMALERYLALTRVFLYQKRVTYNVIKWWVGGGWGAAAALTCLPIAGLGLYWDPRCARCLRYREATSPTDIAYACVFMFFGTALCGVLVVCNLSVIRALYAISAPRAGAAPPAVRRYSHASARRRQNHDAANSATAEEVAFSRLMATVSVLFMICWLPQMVTNALYLWLGRRAHADRRLQRLSAAADVMMLLNYVLNPVLYVLLRQRRNLCATLADCFKRNHRASSDSVKTSYCPDTALSSEKSDGPPAGDHLLVSFAPNNEMKPLRHNSTF